MTHIQVSKFLSILWIFLVFWKLLLLRCCRIIYQTQPTFEMTPGFKPFTISILFSSMPCRLLRSIAWEKVKQLTFGDATTGFPAKWRPRNECRNSILMTLHYPELGIASDWSCRVGKKFKIQPIRSTTQIWVVMRHQYGISVLVSQTSFGGETSGSVAKCRLFYQAKRSTKTFTGSNVKQTIRHLNYELEDCSLFYKLLLSGRSI